MTAEFLLTDGTTVIDLLSKNYGFHIADWRQAITGYKGGGTFQDSPLADGRQMVNKQFENGIETISLTANNVSQDGLIFDAQELLRLLEKATNYWTTDWQTTPVYIQTKASRESNTRYATIRGYQIPELSYPFGSPFLGPNCDATFDNLTLIIERGPWFETAPGTATVIEASASEDYDGRTLGFATATTDPVIVGNRRTTANLTDVYNFDDSAGTYSSNLMDAALPFEMFPNPGAINDAMYFGIDTSLSNSGPFCNLVFDIGTSNSGSVIQMIWQYWDGSTWSLLPNKTALNIGGGALQGLSGFVSTGLTVVSWDQPDDWATTSINGVTGYWVRAFLQLATSLTNPTQANRLIFTASWNYLEIASGQVGGDYFALAQLISQFMSVGSFQGIASYSMDWFTVGLRSTDRGSDFTSIINIADEQNPSGVTITAGTNTTIGTDTISPTGRAATFNPTGAASMTTRVTIEIDETLAANFYGRFRAFLRCRQTSGSVGDIQFRIAQATGLGTAPFIANPQTQTVAVDDELEVVDLGLITLEQALSGQIPTFKILLQASAVDGTPNLIMYDLVLIPVDEMVYSAFFSPPGTEPAPSYAFNMIDLDSIGSPKFAPRSTLRAVTDGSVIASYVSAADQMAIPPNKAFRLWFLSTDYNSPIEALIRVVWAVNLYRQQRYLSMRGGR